MGRWWWWWWQGMGGGGGLTCMGGRHMLLLLYGCLSEERHVLSESERPFPAVGLQHRDVARAPTPPATPPSKPPGGNHGHINRMPPCATAPSVEDESQLNALGWGGLLMLDMKQKSLISVVVLILSSALRRLSMILKPDICQVVFFFSFHCWQHKPELFF